LTVDTQSCVSLPAVSAPTQFSLIGVITEKNTCLQTPLSCSDFSLCTRLVPTRGSRKW